MNLDWMDGILGRLSLHWDHEFVLVPREPALPAWGATFLAIFRDAAPTNAVETRAGTLASDAHSFPFAAATLYDPMRKDASGRRVQHFVVLFGEPDQIQDEFLRTLPH